MRLAGLIPAFALACATPLAAQSDSGGLRENEVLLEVDATGVAVRPADRALVSLQVLCKGKTLAEARAKSEAEIAKVMAAARDVGVEPRDIRVHTPAGPLGMPEEFAMGMAATAGGEDSEPQHQVRRIVEIVLRDPGRWEALRKGLEANGAQSLADPVYSLSDDASAVRAAKLEAVRRARADAEAYAAGLGMRVDRILKVSDRARTDFADLYSANNMANMMRMMRDGSAMPARDIETRARVSVDFALVPSVR